MSGQHKTSAYDEPQTPEELSRSSFLANATIAMSGVIGLVLAVPLLASTIPSKKLMEQTKGSWAPLRPEDFAKLKNSADPIKLSFMHRVQDGYFAPADVEDYVWGVRMSEAQQQKMKTDRPDLFQSKAGGVDYPVFTMGFTIFSSVCPHLGCKFAWQPEKSKFFCPCHNSEFTRDGEHIAGPAPRGLDPLPLRERSGKAEVTWIRYKATTPSRIVVSYS